MGQINLITGKKIDDAKIDNGQKSFSVSSLPILETIIPASAGLGAALKTGSIQKQTMAQQMEARDLARRARYEKDPMKRQQLLDESKRLSQEAGERATGYEKTVRSSMGTLAGRESPTSGWGAVKTYAPQAIRTGVTAGSLVVPMLGGAGLTGFTGTAGKRIAGAALEGGVLGGLYGGAKEDEATVMERINSAVVGLGTGAVLGAAIQGSIEAVGGIKNAIQKSAGKVRDKLKNAYKNTLKRNIKDKNFYRQAGGEDKLVEDAVKYNIPSTKDGVIRELERFGPEYNAKITELATLAEKQGQTVNIGEAFKRAKKETLDSFSHDDTLRKAAEKWFKANEYKYVNQVAAKPLSANSLRKRFDKKVGSMVVGDINVASDKARKMFASQLRGQFKEIVGSEGKMAIRKYQLLSGLSEAMMKEPKMGIVELTGAAVSPGTGVYNLLELLGAKAVRSPGLRREISKKGIQQFSKNIGVNAGMQVNPATLQGLLLLLGQTQKAK